MLVAVEGQRLAPLLQIGLRRMQVVERVLRSGKAKMQELAGGVVDIDEQGAFGTAVLEPPVMRTVNLHQLAKAVTSAAWLENPFLALPARNPDASLGHPLPQRLLGHRDPMQFGQLLARQCRTEIQITFADQIQRRIAKFLAMAPIARSRSLLGNETGWTIQVIGLQQPMHLTSTEVEQFGSLDNAQALTTDLLDDFEAMQFFLRHGDQTGHDDSDRSWSRPG